MRKGAYRANKAVSPGRKMQGKVVFLSLAAFVLVGALGLLSLAAAPDPPAAKALQDADSARAALVKTEAAPTLAPVRLAPASLKPSAMPQADGSADGGLRLEFSPAGVRVASALGEQPVWQVGLDLRGYGYGEAQQSLGVARASASGNKVSYSFENLSVTYLSTAKGLTQHFSVPREPKGRPTAEVPLLLRIDVSGTLSPILTASGQSVDFQLEGGEVALRYGSLRATDANDKDVPVRIDGPEGALGAAAAIRVLVEESGAAYPLAIEATIGAPKSVPASPEVEATTPLPRSIPRTDAACTNLLTTIADPLPAGSCNPTAKAALGSQGNAVGGSDVNVVASVAAAPTNDDCAGAVTLTQGVACTATAGTSVDATQSLAPSTCSGFTSSGANDVWFRFVATTTNPTIQVTGTGGFDSVVELRSGACDGTFVSCADATVGNGVESISATGLTVGATYYVRVYGWFASTPTGTFTICVFTPSAPSNDTCAGAVALTLDTPFAGSNALAVNDYVLGGTLATCYTADGEVGQTSTLTGLGRDTVYRFTASAAGLYSFRAINQAAGGNLLLYSDTTCPTAPPLATITCAASVKAANRNASTSALTAAEEIMCKSMTAGETRYLFVDEGAVTTTGGPYVVEVNRCTRETEPNDSPAAAQAQVCGIEGSINPANNFDYYQLGTPAADSRVFAFVDQIAGNTTDSRMRITSTADTLEFDEDDNTTAWGSLAPNISGRPLTGVASYVQLSPFSATTLQEPYRLYTVVQPPGTGLGGSSATAETEPNGVSLSQANTAPGNFFSGTISTGGVSGDLDLFGIGANAGDLIVLGIDGDPLRDLTPTDFALFLFDANGNQLIAVTDTNVTSNNTSGAGSLISTTPSSPGEGGTWRARYSGTYYAGINTQSAAQTGDYLYSIGINCLRGDELSADVSVTKSGPAAASAGTDATYTITVNNAGPNAATGVTFTDTFPANTTFVSLLGPAGWSCRLVAGGLSCTNPGLGASLPQVFTLVVHIPQCFGNGDATNAVTVSSVTPDPNSGNNATQTLTTVSDPGTCDDGSACTTGDTCVGIVCQGGPPPSCDDGSACTTNFCNPATDQCENPAIACDDNNTCTDDTCNAQTGCVFTPNDNNTCTDNNLCTQTDVCQNSVCVGQNPVVCNPDANVCTTEACNPATGLCESTNNTNPCDDGNACTTGDICGPTLAESFDSVTAPNLPALWTTAVTGTGNPWTTVSASSDTAPNSAFGFDGALVADEVLVSPPIAISSASATLTFRNRWSFEGTTTFYDGGVLEIDIAGGGFTDIVTAGGSFVSGGYTGVISSCCSNPLATRTAWTGSSVGYPAYVTTIVNLPAAAAGQTIQLLWRVGTDSSVSAPGQNIDSIALLDGSNTCHPGMAITAPPETQDVRAAADKITYVWAPAAFATQYDVVRGSLAALPVGPGGDDEFCFENLGGTTLGDPTVPDPDTGFWYLSRGENSCGNGTWGGSRVTTTCP